MSVLYPSLYQVNTRVWLTDLAKKLKRPATLDDVSDGELDRLAEMGFDWIWFLSVWTTGPKSQKVSRSHGDWQREFKETLPDLKDEDVAGSGFAIENYKVSPDLGGDAALARLRKRLEKRGLKLMIDFVPNHMGLDHPWVESHPDYFIAGTEDDLAREPQNYIRLKRKKGILIFAYGRDPYFSGWSDTLQLDYSNPKLQEAMTNELIRISGQCDGVRCDMTMLVFPDVFERTWGRRPEPFWPKVIGKIREQSPEFCFMAEVYWSMEWEIQQQGFDYAYDKCLYDRLRAGQARPVREHLYAGLDYQNKLARFLENHDEPRAAATLDFNKHQAAAVITFLSPGLRFFHQGQFEGRKKRISPHLVRAPKEPLDKDVELFYEKLLGLLRDPVVRKGQWRLLECVPAWEGNWSSDCFLAFAWESASGKRLLAVVNYAPHQSQCFVRLPFSDFSGEKVKFQDALSSETHEYDKNDLLSHGLFNDLGPWGYKLIYEQ